MKRVLFIAFLCAFVFLMSLGTCKAQQSGYGGEQEYGDSVQPRDIDTLIPEMDAAAELWLFVEDYRFVTGKMIHLTLQLIWKLGSISYKKFPKLRTVWKRPWTSSMHLCSS